MEEIWKDIKDYEGLYQVSNLGKIRSLDRYRYNGISYYIQKGKILKLQDDKNGYKVINLYKDKKVKNFKVHRIVAQAFIPNPENKEQINHIDGNKNNNQITNLEWCNCTENVRHAFTNNLMTQHNNTPVEQYSLDGSFLKKYNSISEAILELHLNKGAVSSISRCCQHIIPTAYGYIWEYSNNFKYRRYF